MIADGLRFVPTANNQQIVWQASYMPYGLAEISSELVINNIRLSGQYFDAETGLYYNYFRYYDLKIGRYITAVPIGLAGEINTFEYVGGDPIGFVDLLELCRNIGGNVENCVSRIQNEFKSCMDNVSSICDIFAPSPPFTKSKKPTPTYFLCKSSRYRPLDY